MPDLAPPPEEPIPAQGRDRIRAELLAAAQDPDGAVPRARRWVVPVAAAAAVVLVAGLATWAVRTGDDTSGRVGPAASSSSPTPAPTSPSVDASVSPPVSFGPGPSSPPPASQSVDASGATHVGTGPCRIEMVNVLRGATEAVEFTADPDGALTSFWVKGDQFVLCDERGGTTTVHQPLPLTPAADVATYRVSTDSRQQGDPAFFRLAGGIVPAGATDFQVTYTWPDGSTSRSTTVTDDLGRAWWRVVHPYAGGGNELKQPHIQVTVTYAGAAHHYELAPALDTCAQADHGC